jgi:uncharacterized protein YidB (DUF937 family)
LQEIEMANATLGRIILAGLGVLAYKNRDRLGEIFRPTQTDPNAAKVEESIFDQLTKSGGLGEILDKLRNAGAGGAVDSWVGRGKNEPLDPSHMEAAIDEETLQSLSKQTGMSREELLRRLATNLPETVDELSPEGELPESPPGWSERPTLLDPVPSDPSKSGAAKPDGGVSRSPVADRNTDGPRRDGNDPRTVR